MHRSRQLIASAVVSLSLVANSTAALAAAPSPQPANDAWLALSMLTPSGAAMLGSAPVTAACGAAAAATATAQPAGGCVLPQVGATPAALPSAPPPPAFVGATTPPLPVILLWVALIGLDAYLVLRHEHHDHPNSPA